MGRNFGNFKRKKLSQPWLPLEEEPKNLNLKRQSFRLWTVLFCFFLFFKPRADFVSLILKHAFIKQKCHCVYNNAASRDQRPGGEGEFAVWELPPNPWKQRQCPGAAQRAAMDSPACRLLGHSVHREASVIKREEKSIIHHREGFGVRWEGSGFWCPPSRPAVNIRTLRASISPTARRASHRLLPVS